MRRSRGCLIVFEGPDGCGKSTQAEMLARHLRKRHIRMVHTREPGGTVLAEGIRNILLDSRSQITPLSELLLYESARAQHTEEKILPALERGKVVISERYTLASLAYQGYGRGIPLSSVRTLNRIATAGLQPDLIVLLDLSPKQGLLRARRRRVLGRSPTVPAALRKCVGRRRKLDRLEREALAFHKRVRQGYLALAGKNPSKIRVIDASLSPSQVHQQVIQILEKEKLL